MAMGKLVKITPKRSYRRKRTVKRRSGLQRSMVLYKRPNFNNYFFKRRFIKGTLTFGGLAETFLSYTFKLTDLPNYQEFTNLFDRYRINKVTVTIIPNWTANDANPITTTERVNPCIYSLIDYTEDGLPTSLNDMFEDTQCKVTRGAKVHSRTFRPAILQQAFKSTITTGYQPAWGKWITTDDSAMPYYCLKVGLDKTQTQNNNWTAKVFMTYYIQCKDVK